MVGAVFLLGGQGAHLGGLTSDRPKPLADLNGNPFLTILKDHLLERVFSRFLLATSNKHDMTRSQRSDNYLGTPFSYCEGKITAGTGFTAINARENLTIWSRCWFKLRTHSSR